MKIIRTSASVNAKPTLTDNAVSRSITKQRNNQRALNPFLDRKRPTQQVILEGLPASAIVKSDGKSHI
jgi:hypothetical protein